MSALHRHPHGQRTFCGTALLAAVLLAGCQSEPAQFVLNREGGLLKEATAEQLQELTDVMTALFGTPDEPYAFPETGLDLNKLQMAAGPVWSNQQGVKQGLFRRHCAHCHGVTGDGAGPTALFLNPYPRDYRRGIFKFKSTYGQDRPTDEDLHRILVNGIPGTAMPSFALLPRDEVEALVEYVKYLSIRGEVEFNVRRLLVDEEEPIPLSQELIIEECLNPVLQRWKQADDQVTVPAPREDADLEASIALGRKLYQDTKRAQCINCHGPTALGDSDKKLYDDWNARKVEPGADPADFALPLQEIRPRNLRLNVYRGGRRPMDLYYRIYNGIAGTPMPSFGSRGGAPDPGKLSPEEIWALVDYVRTLPYEPTTASPGEHAGFHRARN